MKKNNQIAWLVASVLLLFCLIAFNANAQVYPGNYNPTNLFPVSYFYTNPLFNIDYGYINSITDPFYYLGYGYYPPITGNLLGSYVVNPFLNIYEDYLYNYFGLDTYPNVNSPYTTAFPYNTLPGTFLPYTRFSYPSYVYGAPSNYLSWVLFQ